MTRTPIIVALALFLAALVGGLETWRAASAQDGESGRFVRFIENQISTPDMQIRLGQIQGALSSNVRFSAITIADREGVWLRIENAHLVWSRLALLRGRLEIDSLTADRIAVARTPLPAETGEEMEIPEDGEFSLPDIPVAIRIGELLVPEVEIDQAVFGRAADLSVEGGMVLEGGSLDAQLAVERLDAGGSLTLDVAFSNETRQLALDLSLSEPEDGVVANLLNVEGRPPLSFAIQGEGSLDDFAADISLVAEDEQLLAGNTTISQVPGGLRFVADVGGNVQRLVPALYRDLFGAGTRLVVDATRADSGAISIARADVASGVMQLSAAAEIADDGFPTLLDIEGRLAADDGEPVLLPGGGGRASVRAASFEVSLGGEAGETWSAVFDLDELDTATVTSERTTIRAGGIARNMNDPDTRQVTFELEGAATGLASDDAEIARALGESIELAAEGSWNAGEPVDLPVARIVNENAEASFVGEIGEAGLDGDFALRARDLAAFAGLAGQDLAGAVDIDASGTVALGGEAFSLDVEGSARNLDVGVEVVRPLLRGQTNLAGRATRGATGFRFDAFTVENPQVSLRLDGAYGDEAADLTLDARLDDVGLLTERASGAVAIVAALSGDPDRPNVAATVSGEELVLMEQAFSDAEIRFDGTLDGAAVEGNLAMTGDLGGVAVDVTTRIASLEDGTRAIENLDARIGDATAAGDLRLAPDLFVTGELSLDVPDLAEIAPLLLAEASGAVRADIALMREEDGQAVDLTADIADLVYETYRIGLAEIALAGRDIFSVPRLAGTIDARVIAVGDTVIESLTASAEQEGEATRFDLAAVLAQGRLQTAGALTPIQGGYQVDLDTLSLTDSVADMQLAAPTSVTVRGATVEIPGADLTIGDGRVTVSGRWADTIDLDAEIADLPLAIANAVQPDLAASGTISGTLNATGTADAPVVDFDLIGRNIAAEPLRQAGIDEIGVAAEGQLSDGTVTLAAVTNIAGGEITVTGSIGELLDLTAEVTALPLSVANAVQPDLGLGGTVSGTVRATGSLDDPSATFDVRGRGISAALLREAGVASIDVDADGRYAAGTATLNATTNIGGGRISVSGSVGEVLDMTAEIAGLPLSLANAVQPELGLQGTLSGTVNAAGSLDNPRASFNVTGQGISAQAMRDFGVAPLALAVQGSFENDTVTLASATAEGGGISLRAQGAVPIDGAGLDLGLAGTVPLTLADQALAARGARLTGTLALDIRVAGSFADPSITGTINADGARFIDPDSGVDLAGIILRTQLQGDVVVIQQLSAGLGDGTVNVTGTVGIDPATGFPADLAVALRNARYEDGRLVSATVNGDLTLNGQLTGAPVLGGFINIDRAEITVPETLPSGATLLDVEHNRPPPAVLATLRKARLDQREPAEGAAGGGGLVLNITVDAPARIFVRGRGLDAELGGRVTLTGPVDAIQPVGSFEMRRGRLDILGQRITFDRGEVALIGDLDPYLDFVATTRGGSITVTATVTGRASDPDIGFSSVPELPQDEVLAQLLFGRSVDNLSAFQLVQLGAAAAELAGAGGGPGLLGSLRESTGLDDLDVVTDAEGGAAVQAGRYISENVYLGVRAGSEESGVSVNLDITDNLTARGEVGTRGDSKAGIFFEREY